MIRPARDERQSTEGKIIRIKLRSRTIFLILIVLIAASAALMFIMGSRVPEVPSGAKIVSQQLKVWSGETGNYLFLPSGIEVKDLSGDSESSAAAASPNMNILQSRNLPSVWITTESGTHEELFAGKDVKLSGEVSFLDESGSLLGSFALDYVKTRGNSSFVEYDKKQYQIKLETAQSLFGMAAGKRWILTANATDHSLIRNALSRRLGKEMGFPMCGDGQFLDLYINGEYQGNYYLCERIEVSDTRLDITDLEKLTEKVNKGTDLSSFEDVWGEASRAKQIPNDPPDITGGYLFEREFYDRFEKEAFENESYFRTNAGECFIMESPESISVRQMEYISGLVQEAENAILSEDGYNADTGLYYLDYIDLDSFAGKYVLEETVKNYDGGSSSSYFYKDRDQKSRKIYAGPPWDYDLTFGSNPDFIGELDTSPEELTKLLTNTNGTPWFGALYDKEEFFTRVTQIYESAVRPVLERFIKEDGDIDELEEKLSSSAAMDQVRWNEMYAAAGNGQDLTGDYGSRQSDAGEIRSFISRRMKFLDSIW